MFKGLMSVPLWCKETYFNSSLNSVYTQPLPIFLTLCLSATRLSHSKHQPRDQCSAKGSIKTLHVMVRKQRIYYHAISV